MRPVGWPFYAVCTLILLGFLWESLKPHSFRIVLVLAFTVWTIGPVWIMRLGVALTLRRIYKHREPTIWRFLGRFACVLLLPAIMLVLLETRWMEQVGFWLARPAMNRLVADVRAMEAARVPSATKPTRHASRRVGPFYAVYVKFIPESGAVAFSVQGAGFIEGAGFVHTSSPNTAPKPTGDFGIERQLDDHWWSASF